MQTKPNPPLLGPTPCPNSGSGHPNSQKKYNDRQSKIVSEQQNWIVGENTGFTLPAGKLTHRLTQL
ncbi:hypothetical protein L484_014180 [Morus notabilis]|uniref:Uncharacterized protein n=1 Tax=Morus notabilis TaxID=981085 RepID=W9RJW2_9ROSA|nr:hypothetical protein L484_014180 [Morus notabilis]